MRRFEYKKGTSNKFWQIELTGNSYTVKFGKIGTAGLFQIKEFGCEAAAKKDYERMVHEKLKKGYVEILFEYTPGSMPTAAAAPPPVTAPGKPNRRSIVI